MKGRTFFPALFTVIEHIAESKLSHRRMVDLAEMLFVGVTVGVKVESTSIKKEDKGAIVDFIYNLST